MADSPSASGACLCGACLCGAVSMTIKHLPSHIDACHCSMCRKWGGGPALGFGCNELDIKGTDNVTAYDSSDWAQRAFCKTCGTHLYYRLKALDQYFVPAGFFQNLQGIEFTEEIFYDEKPAYYSFANPTHKLTGEEVFAKYAVLNPLDRQTEPRS